MKFYPNNLFFKINIQTNLFSHVFLKLIHFKQKKFKHKRNINLINNSVQHIRGVVNSIDGRVSIK